MTTEVAPPLAAGRLKLREILGEGGVGTVYLAYDERLDVERAVKVLAQERASNQIQRQRFLTEARIQARLRHPNIVEVYDIEDDGTQVYLVMELVAGGSLWDRLKADGPMPPDEATRVAIGILAALEKAHEQDIVHRDIKPHNILMTDRGVPKLADFGVAHLPSEEHGGVTRTGVVMGTWSFMAPEQRASSRRVDPRSDIYAVAASLYTLVTGYTEPDLFDFEPDEEVFRRLPEPLRPVIHRATRYARSERYPDADTLRQDLERSLPALEGRDAAPWPTLPPTDAPDAAHHLALGSRGPVPTTQDRPRAGADKDVEAPSGTLVPSPAEVERLLATPTRNVGATYSDDGRTLELPPSGLGRPDHDTAEAPVELPIDGHPDASASPDGDGLGWTIDDERQLTDEVAEDEIDDDEPIRATWRSAGRIRFLLFLLALTIGSAVAVGAQQGWIEIPESLREIVVGSAPGPTVEPMQPEPAPGLVPEVEPEAPRPQPGSPPPRPEAPAPQPELEVQPEAPTPEPEQPEPEQPEPEQPEPQPEQPEPQPEQPEPEPEVEVTTFMGLVKDESDKQEILGRIRDLEEHTIWECYHQALLTNPRLEGTLELHWGIGGGKVYSPKVWSSPQGHGDIGRCAVEAASNWRYPPWFESLPVRTEWHLDPMKQTGRLIDARRNELLACSKHLSDDDPPELGRGQLNLEIRDGWVRNAIVPEGFEHQPLRDCLHNTAMAWKLPAYATGDFFMQLEMPVTVIEN
jgi:serine/threonine protein kinase